MQIGYIILKKKKTTLCCNKKFCVYIILKNNCNYCKILHMKDITGIEDKLMTCFRCILIICLQRVRFI